MEIYELSQSQITVKDITACNNNLLLKITTNENMPCTDVNQRTSQGFRIEREKNVAHLDDEGAKATGTRFGEQETLALRHFGP